ncbi:MerR family transcriptional regulator [Sphaerisporangium sp. TRM90804]|uniref:MerR family transcriptional regulator n=1 Tax=Sphaerisporangium sp. TRM90804 TaxID=3031113 RepID=UPI00244BFD66|nr:MerR family transcriptional regulator [Sphaerisporangium sp. TRM90804]MDH2429158.1 MerR family transcriptional regulator [Sphaerisporangium sp. TRM90804]
MDGDGLYSIGELAERTGLTVKAIRFYSDRGIVPPSGRSPAGYRLYDADALARLELVRTLRDLGLDLSTIRKVVEREISLADVAAAHAEALAVQIRTLRLRRAVLTAVAERGSTPKEIDLMHKLAKLSEDERRRLIGEFLDAAFDGLDVDHRFAGARRTMTPELPGDPEAEQVRAWVELAELSQDPGFRTGMRRMAEHHAADRSQSGTTTVQRDSTAMVREQAGPAVEAGIAPSSPEAGLVVASVTSRYAHALGHPDDDALRHRLLTRLEAANDPRREQYSRLLAVINGWAPPETLTPVLDWFIQALRARTPE